MQLSIKHQELYSRGELLLRSILGPVYIFIPHTFLLLFLGIASSAVTLIAWFSILFTGRYPESMYEFQVKIIRWNWRLQARQLNLCDGYPAFGLNATDDYVTVDIPYPEYLSRGKLLLKTLFGVIYVVIPHMFILFFRIIATQVLTFLAFWAVLFTGKYPESWHEFNVGTLRWRTRVNLYMSFMTDEYPPFSGKEKEAQPAPATA